MIDVVDLAYLAGLIDGEGSVIIHRTKPQKVKSRGNGRKPIPDKTPRFVVDVRVSMSDKNVIYWIKDKFGGNVSFMKDKRKPSYKTMYYWGLRANKAIQLIKKVKPYLRTKNLQADLIIYFQENLIRKKGWKGNGIQENELQKREEFYEMNKMLNAGFDPEQVYRDGGR